jgi:hypothetical protein
MLDKRMTDHLHHTDFSVSYAWSRLIAGSLIAAMPFVLLLAVCSGCNNSEVEWVPNARSEHPIVLPKGVTQDSDAGRTYIYWQRMCQESDSLRQVRFQIRFGNTADFEAQRDEFFRVANKIDRIPVEIGVDPDAAVLSKTLSAYLRAAGEFIYWRASSKAALERALEGFKGPSAHLGEPDRQKIKDIEDQEKSLIEKLQRTRVSLQLRYRVEFCFPELFSGGAPSD